METLYFISVGIYWAVAIYAGNQIKHEAMTIATFYAQRWGIDIDQIPVEKMQPSRLTVMAIICSLIPVWNVLSAFFIWMGIAPMKRSMWNYMDGVDRKSMNDMMYF